MELKGHYSREKWGRCGVEGLAGLLAWENAGRKFELTGPLSSLAASSHRRLRTVIAGQALRDWLEVQGLGDLPFIAEVHSLRAPAPITCHPNKVDIKRLRAKCPTQFSDKSAKEIMLVSKGYSLISIGLRPISQIKWFLKRIPEFTVLIPDDVITNFLIRRGSNVRELLHWLFKSSDLKRQLAIDVILTRIEKRGCQGHDLEYFFFKRINDIYKNDVGVFLPFFFNITVLPPGTAVYITPTIPYSLLFGEFISVSSKSLNTVRVGMECPNPDAVTFLEVANLCYHPLHEHYVPFKEIDLCVKKYQTINSKLTIDRIAVPQGVSYELVMNQNPSILLIIKGHIQSNDFRLFEMGSIVFLPPEECFYFKVPQGVSYELVMNQNPSILLIIKGPIQSNDFRLFKMGSIIFLPPEECFYFQVIEDTILYRTYCE